MGRSRTFFFDRIFRARMAAMDGVSVNDRAVHFARRLAQEGSGERKAASGILFISGHGVTILGKGSIQNPMNDLRKQEKPVNILNTTPENEKIVFKTMQQMCCQDGAIVIDEPTPNTSYAQHPQIKSQVNTRVNIPSKLNVQFLPP